MTTVLQVLATALASAAFAGIAVSWWHHRRLSRAGTAFPCRISSLAAFRVGRGTFRVGRGNRSGIGRARAVWVHDVLLVQRGWLLSRLQVLPVRLSEDSMRFAARGEASGPGRRPLVMELRLDDGAVVAVAAASRNRTLLAGPFLAAAIATLTPHRE